MSYDVDIEGRRRHLLILDGKENAGSGEEENEDNQDGYHGPSQLDLGAAVDLGRLAVIVGITLPEADHYVQPKGGNHDKNRSRYLQNEKRQMMDQQRRTGVRIEGVRSLVDDIVRGHSPSCMSRVA